MAGGFGAGGGAVHRGAGRRFPHLLPLPAAVRLLPPGHPPRIHGQLGLPCPLHPGEAAGGLRGPPGAAQHGQHLLLPQSGRALPGVCGAAAEATGSSPAGQRHSLLFRGQQLHRVGFPLPAVRAPPVPHSRHQPCLQLWDRRLRLWCSLPLARPRLLRGDLWQEGENGAFGGGDTGGQKRSQQASPKHGGAPLGLSPRGNGGVFCPPPASVFSSAGFCTHRIKRPISTPTRRRWPGSTARTPRCRWLSARWSAPSAPARSCTFPTAGGTPRSTWTPASSSPPSWGRAGKDEDVSPLSRPRWQLRLLSLPGKGSARFAHSTYWCRDQVPEEVLGFFCFFFFFFNRSFPSPLD